MQIVPLPFSPRLASLVIGAAIASEGCASIWGFQDARDLVDGDIGDNETSIASLPDAAIDDGCVCVPPVPIGWNGPYAILHVEAGASPSCPDPYPNVVYDAGAIADAAATTCHCSCAEATGMRCEPGPQSYYSDSQCHTSPCAKTNAAPGDCFGTPGSACAKEVYFTVGTPVATGGLCAPIPTVNTAVLDWTLEALLCGASTTPPTGLCGGTDSICLPHTRAPLDVDTFCISTSGSAHCPAKFVNLTAVYDDGTGTDTRDCTACTCGVPSGATCSGSITTYANTTCGGTGVTNALPLACTGLMGSNISFALTTPQGGSCAPEGGVPIGAFVPNQTTVCCSVTTGL